MDAASLEREIKDAFSHVPTPDPAAIAPCPCEECDELRSSFAPFNNDTIPSEILDKHRWDLPLLSDDGKHHFLPAWLVRSIRDPESDYTDAVVFAIDSDHRWLPSIPYTDAEWRALEHYLDFIEPRVHLLERAAIQGARTRLKGGR